MFANDDLRENYVFQIFTVFEMGNYLLDSERDLVTEIKHIDGRVMRKRAFEHMRTAKAQIRLRIRAADLNLRCPLLDSLVLYM